MESLDFGDLAALNHLLAEKGTRLVWCSDEFYLLARRPLPEEDYYEEFTQLDNGVGMLRLLRQEFRSALALEEGSPRARRSKTVGYCFFIPTGEQPPWT